MNLIAIYTPLIGLVLLGLILGRYLSKVVATRLGQFLFWVGVPISIVAFLRQADLSGQIWIAPAIAWIAIVLGVIFAGTGIRLRQYLKKDAAPWRQPTQGSFILAAMVGNTGYLGYPITLAIAGTQYFGFALFYDLLGTTLGAYGVGVALAARFGGSVHNHRELAQAILINPSLWSFGFGFFFRRVPLPESAAAILQGLAWTMVALSLVLIGMRLSQLHSWHSLPRASVSLLIKMLLVPLILGSSLSLLGINGTTRLVLVLQTAMPPAFATLVIAEAYDLDRDLAVTALAVGTIGILFLLPIWIYLFGN
ncbi:AEC family transporter [Gloeocapsopsis dulcis]|uniref:Transporter n=1 Tax=Gloeocapsopsis dulcis AAB1 = 1H9 TaxID=1433147 RepID=A0A6N8FZ36_9CHRO|nr:AEC family transporter [Gloeocapsopsis dulcis]MUL37595.1 transporter [Gloeocapsopsis dulcis AAB1 = 1H9]WNN89271.1 AEC family transporter [Gloeocapsopsis dulcis]